MDTKGEGVEGIGRLGLTLIYYVLILCTKFLFPNWQLEDCIKILVYYLPRLLISQIKSFSSFHQKKKKKRKF